MALCRNCGARVEDGASACPSCGFREGEDRWAPPAARPAPDTRDPAPFGYSASGQPRRISLLSKLALALALLLPPAGLVLGIAATAAARRHRNRPGNKAMALSSIFAALHIGMIWGWVAFLVAIEPAGDPYDAYGPLAAYPDPFATPAPPAWDTDPVNAESTEELRRLLEQLVQAEAGGEPLDPAAPPP
jgi:hypothetical protein